MNRTAPLSTKHQPSRLPQPEVSAPNTPTAIDVLRAAHSRVTTTYGPCAAASSAIVGHAARCEVEASDLCPSAKTLLLIELTSFTGVSALSAGEQLT